MQEHSFYFDDIWPKQEQQEMGAEALNQDFISGIKNLPQILQPRLQLWGPSLSLHVQHFHWSLSTQAACFAAGIIIFFKRVISTTRVFFLQHKNIH